MFNPFNILFNFLFSIPKKSEDYNPIKISDYTKENQKTFLVNLCTARVGNFFMFFTSALILYTFIFLIFQVLAFLFFNSSKTFLFFKYSTSLHIKNKTKKQRKKIMDSIFPDYKNQIIRNLLEEIISAFFYIYFYIKTYAKIISFSFNKRNVNSSRNNFVNKKTLISLMEKRKSIFFNTLGFISPFKTFIFLIGNFFFSSFNFMFNRIFHTTIANYFLNNFFNFKFFHCKSRNRKYKDSLIPLKLDIFLFIFSLLFFGFLMSSLGEKKNNVFNNIIYNVSNKNKEKHAKKNIFNKSQIRLIKVQYENKQNMIFDRNYKINNEVFNTSTLISVAMSSILYFIVDFILPEQQRNFFNYFYISSLPYEIVNDTKSDVMRMSKNYFLCIILNFAMNNVKSFAQIYIKELTTLFIANFNEQEYLILI